MRILICVCLSLMAANSPTLQAAPMFRGDASHSGATDTQGPRQFHRIRWTFPTGGRLVSSPVWWDGAVYFGGDDGYVYAVDAASGRQRWKRATQGPVPATPAIADGTLFVPSYDGKLYALNASTGAVRWKFTTGGERRFEGRGLHGMLPKTQTIADPFDVYLSSPVVDKGLVYFGSGDGNVYAVESRSGALRWKVQTGDVVHASPALVDGVVYVGSWDSYFYAIDAATGAVNWKFHSGEDPLIHKKRVGFQSSAAVVNGIVYVGCRDSNLYALEASTGREKWRVSTALSWVITSPAVVAGKVIFGTSDSSLYHVVDAVTGAPVLERQDKAYMFSSPTVAGDVVYIGLLNGTLQARDFTTGEALWSFETEASKRNDGWILTADRRFNTPMFFRSPWREAPIVATDRQFSVGSFFATPLVADGAVFVGSTDGKLYALE